MSAHDSLAMTSPSVRSCGGRSRAVPARLALCSASARQCCRREILQRNAVRVRAQVQKLKLWTYGLSPQEREKHRRVTYVSCHQASQEYTPGITAHTCMERCKGLALHTHTRTQPSLSAEQCVILRSLCASLWEWFVGAVGELTRWWANNNRMSQKYILWFRAALVFGCSQPLHAWADWRLSNLHSVIW